MHSWSISLFCLLYIYSFDHLAHKFLRCQSHLVVSSLTIATGFNTTFYIKRKLHIWKSTMYSTLPRDGTNQCVKTTHILLASEN